MRRRITAVLLLVALVAPAAGARAMGGASSPSHALVIRHLTSRVLQRTVPVTLLLPQHRVGQRHPVLYLLAPAGAEAQDWIDRGDLIAAVRGTTLIVVVVSAAQHGWYSDWVDGPSLEQHHIDELVPWVDDTFATDRRRATRAIAGAGTGALGALAYAARHPGVFGAAAALSGPVAPVMGAPNARPPDGLWGPITTDEVRWRDHSPGDLAANLANTAVWLGASAADADAYVQSTALHHDLRRAGTPHEWQPNSGPGGWAGWAAALRAALPVLRGGAPSGAEVRSFDFSWASQANVGVHGWRFAAYRDAVEFAEVLAVRPTGFVARGSGVLDVTTPPLFDPARTYEVAGGWRKSNRSHRFILWIRPGSDRRLRFIVKLDASHRSQQFTPSGRAEQLASGADHIATSDVRIHAMQQTPPRGAAPVRAA